MTAAICYKLVRQVTAVYDEIGNDEDIYKITDHVHDRIAGVVV
jgi:hypothetical protein